MNANIDDSLNENKKSTKIRKALTTLGNAFKRKDIAEKSMGKGTKFKPMSLEQLESELIILKKEREEILAKRYELSQDWTERKRYLELYSVTGPISKYKSRYNNNVLEEQEEELNWYINTLKEIDDVIREIEEKKNLAKSEKE